MGTGIDKRGSQAVKDAFTGGFEGSWGVLRRPEVSLLSNRGVWGLCEGHRRFIRLLGGLRRYKGSWGVCLFNGDPRQSKKDHRGFPGVLEGAEETWGVTF